jgi:hypothetical protein
MGDHLQHQKRNGKKNEQRESSEMDRRERQRRHNNMKCCGALAGAVLQNVTTVAHEHASKHDTCASSNAGSRTR